MLAITHVPSPHMDECQRTYVAPSPIDDELALAQHERYCQLLRQCGADVRTLDVSGLLPDAAFVEDVAVVLDEIAVLCSLGAPSRRGETAGIEAELGRHRGLRRIEPPATLEGGDVLRVGRRLFVGLSSRTNSAGVDALAHIAGRWGYEVVAVRVEGCLHLKTACTWLGDGKLLVNRAWLDEKQLPGFELVDVPKTEPWAANVLSIGGRVCLPAAHVRTAEMLAGQGLDVHTVDLSEFAKAEGGVTCLSIIIDEA